MRQGRGPLHAVFQFAHITREAAAHQHFQRAGVERKGPAVLFVEAPEKFARQLGDIAATLAQRRHQHRHHADAVIQVGAKFVARHRFFEVFVGCRDDPHIDLDGVIAADALELLLLQDAQKLGLEGRGNLADLVEENRALVGEFESPLARADGAGEGSLFMTEQFGLKDRFRQRRAIYLHEGSLGAGRQLVDCLGDQFLAGSGFAAQQHG